MFEKSVDRKQLSISLILFPYNSWYDLQNIHFLGWTFCRSMLIWLCGLSKFHSIHFLINQYKQIYFHFKTRQRVLP